jgi:large conductance mechanosensitive channel
MKSLFAEFREFLNRGNFLDFAVAVVIGGAVTLVVESIVLGLITPIIAAVFGENNIAEVGSFTINGAQFSIGIVLNALIYFVSVCLVIFFLLKAYNRAMRKDGPVELKKPAPAITNDLLTEIRDLMVAQQGGTPPPPAPPQV